MLGYARFAGVFFLSLSLNSCAHNSVAIFTKDEFGAWKRATRHNQQQSWKKTRLPCPIFREQWPWFWRFGSFVFVCVWVRASRKGADNLCNCTQYLSHSMKAQWWIISMCCWCCVIVWTSQDSSHQIVCHAGQFDRVYRAVHRIQAHHI